MDFRSQCPFEVESKFQGVSVTHQKSQVACDRRNEACVPELGLMCDHIILISSLAPDLDYKLCLVISALSAVIFQLGENFRVVEEYTLLNVKRR